MECADPLPEGSGAPHQCSRVTQNEVFGGVVTGLLHTRSVVAVASINVSRQSVNGLQIAACSALQGCTSYSVELQAVHAADTTSFPLIQRRRMGGRRKKPVVFRQVLLHAIRFIIRPRAVGGVLDLLLLSRRRICINIPIPCSSSSFRRFGNV